jgi:uncharacterized ion transporter superfamily protein YfcC
MSKKKEKKEFKMISSIGLLFFIIVFVAILTYIIPAGEFDREEGESGRPEVIAGSFHYTDAHPASVFDIFLALPEGIVGAAGMVVCTLMIGGGMGVIQRTGALNIGISKAIMRLNKKSGDLVLVCLFIVFSVLGAFMGFAEAAIPFFPIAVAISVGLGYDSMTGVAVGFMGCMLGFIAGPLNQSNVGIPQALAGLPLYSGLGLRIVLYAVLVAIGLYHILRYSKRVGRDPEKSLMHGIDVGDLSFDIEELNKEDFTRWHAAILITLIAGMVFFTYMALTTDWWLNELSAVFVIIAILTGIFGRLGINKTCDAFLEGVADLSGGAIIIGVAGGIQYVMTTGGIMDTIIYAISAPLSNFPPIGSAILMLIVISVINLFIPSGSGKAVAIMPLIFPICNLIGLNLQTAVLVYQLGDGITNLICPTLGVLFIALAFGKIPFDRWVRFCLPVIWKITLVGIVFMIYAVVIGYGPF